MKVFRERKYLIALLALLVVFAACKGESPTAPTAGGGTGGGGSVGGGTPPTGATITLTVSNPNPLVNSTAVVTATVSQNNSPVPNGTAVEFQSAGPGGAPFGVWQDTGLPTTIRTTTNGVATATLTSGTPGTAVVTAIVNNVTRQTTVVFQTTPTAPPTPNTAPTITSINPTSGKVTGGEILTLTGTNFRTPVRVLFDLGGGVVKEGFVSSVTATQIQVVTPQVNIATGQSLDATVILLNEAGTPAETRVTAPGTFTYRLATLTPVVSTVSPDSGPITGGTRITIFGRGFEAPVQVSFAPGASNGGTGWSQMQVISITFDQIIAITPAARDVNPTGSGTLVGAVDLRVRNINSNTEVIKAVIFRYTPAMQITGARPLAGSSLGGTDVTIDGIGFDSPVDVFIGGILAQTIRVSGTQILARTNPLAVPCASSAGPIAVTNINNGDSAIAPVTFGYIGVPSIITSVGGTPLVPGGSFTVNVQDPGVGPLGNAVVRFAVNGQNVAPTPSQITSGTGVQTFTMNAPLTGFTFPTVPCTTASATPGTQLGNITTTILFTNATTGCTATVDGVAVTPPAPNTCLAAPTATVTPAAPACAVAPPVVAAGAVTSTATINIANAASARDLTVTNPTVTCTNAACSIAPLGSTTIVAGASTNWTVTVDPTAIGPVTGTATFTTNDPTKAAITVCITSSGT